MDWSGGDDGLRSPGFDWQFWYDDCFVLIVAAAAAQAAEPTAAGLWQKVEDGKTAGWFLVVDRDGIFEGAIAKTSQGPVKIPTRFARNAPTTARMRPGSDCPSSAT